MVRGDLERGAEWRLLLASLGPRGAGNLHHLLLPPGRGRGRFGGFLFLCPGHQPLRPGVRLHRLRHREGHRSGKQMELSVLSW